MDWRLEVVVVSIYSALKSLYCPNGSSLRLLDGSGAKMPLATGPAPLVVCHRVDSEKESVKLAAGV